MLDDLEDFVQDHQPHGRLVGDASEPGPQGYRVTVACPCGVVFEQSMGWLRPFWQASRDR